MGKVIQLKKVSKRYTITHERPVLLKTLFKPPEKETIWALKDINLTVKKGEVLGVIGENGSGKSTLLKILAGIITPTKGRVKVNGRVGSLIELGAGFHPDLTGKENVYLNGSLLGFSKAELDKKYQKIVDFANIGSFINQPVRTYSSGMVVRLGFSVAIYLEPDILLVDEVLAVGDEVFQQKCLEKIGNFKNFGGSILFVSHDLHLISVICDRVVVLHEGAIFNDDVPEKAVSVYLALQKHYTSKCKSNSSIEIQLVKVEILDKDYKPKKTFSPFESIIARIHYTVKKRFNNPIFGVLIRDRNGQICFANRSGWRKPIIPILPKGKGHVDIIFKKLRLAAGKYVLHSLVWQFGKMHQINQLRKPVTFLVRKVKKFGAGSFYLDHEWRIEDS